MNIDLKNGHNCSRFFAISLRILTLKSLWFEKSVLLISWSHLSLNKSFKLINHNLHQSFRILLKESLLHLIFFHHLTNFLLSVRRSSVYFALETHSFHTLNEYTLLNTYHICETILKIFIYSMYWWSSRSSASILIVIDWFLITWRFLRITWLKHTKLSSDHESFVFFADFSHLAISFPRYMVIRIN